MDLIENPILKRLSSLRPEEFEDLTASLRNVIHRIMNIEVLRCLGKFVA